MKLALPKGFTPPQNARPDEPFEVVATLCACEDGSFELKALDGMKMPEEDEEEDEDEGEMEPVNERNDSTDIKLPFDD